MNFSYPVTKEFREKLYGVILGRYQKEQEQIKQKAEQSLSQNECVHKEVQKQETR